MSLAPNPVRQDLIRGLRWGAILLIAALLVITAFRMWISNPAIAREPATAVAPELAPSPEPAAAPEAVIEIGEAPEPFVSVPASTAAPAPAPAPRAKPAVRKPSKSAKFVAPERTQPVAPAVDSVEHIDPVTLPEVTIAPAPANVEVPGAVATLPPESEPGIGTRARGVVRSVGRFLRLSKKDEKK